SATGSNQDAGGGVAPPPAVGDDWWNDPDWPAPPTRPWWVQPTLAEALGLCDQPGQGYLSGCPMATYEDYVTDLKRQQADAGNRLLWIITGVVAGVATAVGCTMTGVVVCVTIVVSTAALSTVVVPGEYQDEFAIGSVVGGIGAAGLANGGVSTAATVFDDAIPALRPLANNGDDLLRVIGGTACSFSPSTKVTTTSGSRSISDLSVGDKVLARDVETGGVAEHTVVAVSIHEDPSVEYLQIDGETIETTPNHPFLTDHGWVEAGALTTGMRVMKVDGSYGAIETLRTEIRPVWMWDLTIEDVHTFAVGGGRWLAHNCSPWFLEFGPGQLETHFVSHAGEWAGGIATKEAYLARARSLLSSQPGGTVEGFIRTNGDVLRYNRFTNEFAVASANGTIRTLFRPADGLKYWLKQIGQVP
ncbi:MAG TPA: polymorphic toxin-type HINT domain-containing protein, partial [Candidatus Limnocylindrales bacterium]|nr:polymorphic toxin-type HINT domain-containing protein [Candidatus Limnocylindrales bacterium]